MKITSWLKITLDSLYDGILIADTNGIVIYINPAYTRITKIHEDQILYKKLSDVRPGSHLPNVIKNGEKELGIHRKVGEIEYIVNMVPIYANKKIIGGISILNEINDIFNLTAKLNNTKKIIKNLKENVKLLGNGKYSFNDIITEDENSLKIKEFAKKISKTDSNVLIIGESGTGKELYASSIHNYSDRKDFPFIPVNCASFEKGLIESELFGYEKGSFTGADKNGKIGLFELADKGTIFLDEISELDHELQGKLLRVLQEKSIRKIGGYKEIDVDIRLICATNQDLEKMVEEERFRKDLYYRINTIPLTLKPLRERKDDILPITEKFLFELNQKYKKGVTISSEVKKIFEFYDWPGNVRELKNTLEFLYHIIDDNTIKSIDLPEKLLNSKFNTKIKFDKNNILPLKEKIKEFEKEYIKNVIQLYGDNLEGKKLAAKALKISLASLYNKF